MVGMALAAGGLRMSREKRTAVSGQHVQRVRMGKHLRAQSGQGQVQDVQSREGRLDAAGSSLESSETLRLFVLFCTCSEALCVLYNGRCSDVTNATTK